MEDQEDRMSSSVCNLLTNDNCIDLRIRPSDEARVSNTTKTYITSMQFFAFRMQQISPKPISPAILINLRVLKLWAICCFSLSFLGFGTEEGFAIFDCDERLPSKDNGLIRIRYGRITYSRVNKYDVIKILWYSELSGVWILLLL